MSEKVRLCHRTMNCARCGRFMKLIGEWDEFPLGPYVNTEWECSCGYKCITCDDFRLRGEKAK